MLNTFILDIGKTNIKCLVLDEGGETLWSRQHPNSVVDSAPYPHFDVEATWQLLLDSLKQANAEVGIGAINISAHGACAVLVGGGGELVLPVMDYEFAGVRDVEGYDACRPDFQQTFSPSLPAGLNIGRQLFWQKRHFPKQFKSIRTLFMYPQYWAWRLSGVAANEVTSLGCHTDLWLPFEGGYSPLVETLGLTGTMPPLIKADQPLGHIHEDIAGHTGLPLDCQVYPGVHDSNASFYAYLCSNENNAFTVVSTGTWIVSMSTAANFGHLKETRDMLVNVNVEGKPLACARFMGGREFEELCRLTAATPRDSFTGQDIQYLVTQGVYALPCFAESGGPFHKQQGSIEGKVIQGVALATLYTALMIDYELDLLGVSGDVYFGSAAQKNPLLCRLLAQLRPQDRINISCKGASTVRGAWYLTRDRATCFDKGRFEVAQSESIHALEDYRSEWRSRASRTE